MNTSKSWIALIFLLLISVMSIFVYFNLGCNLYKSPALLLPTQMRTIPSSYTEAKQMTQYYQNYITEYINGLIPYRAKWIARTNHLESKLMFGMLYSNQVIKGKDGWLFYSKISDGNPLGHYRGESLFSPGETLTFAQNLNFLYTEMKRLNVKFALYIPPNKEIAYADKMPRYILRTNPISPIQRLVNYTSQMYPSLPIYYLKDSLDSLRENGYETFLKYDTHWNYLTAWFSLKQITDQFGLENDTSHVQILKTINQDAFGLGAIVGLKNTNTLQIDYQIRNYYDPITYKDVRAEIPYLNGVDTKHIFYYRNEKAPNQLRILIIHDSFGEFLYEFAPKLFRETFMVHKLVFNNSYFEKFKPDIVLRLAVERYVGDDTAWFDEFAKHLSKFKDPLN